MKKNTLRITSLLLALLMAFGTIAGAVSVSELSDFPNDWSTEAMTYAVENGLLQGYTNNTIAPAKHMTRAEMATVINRAFCTWKQAEIAFSDVSENDWFYEEVSKAVAFETFKGTSATAFTPNGDVTRAQAFTAIARALKLDAAEASVLSAYQDAAEVPAWATAEVAAMVAAGYVQGANGKLRANAPLTRAEFAQVMYNIIRVYVKDAKFEVVDGNVIVVEDGLTIANKTINGDLIVAANISKLRLNNVTIKGRLLVRTQHDLDLTVYKCTVEGGLVVYSPDQIVTVTTNNIVALKENLKDYTTVVFKKMSTGGYSSGSGYVPSGPVTHAIRIHYPDTKYAFAVEVPYAADDNLFELAERILTEAYGVDGGLIETAFNLGLEKINEKGFLIDSVIPKYEVEDVHEYTVDGTVLIDEKKTLGWDDIGGRPDDIEHATKDEVEDRVEEEIANLRTDKIDEFKAELKSWSATKKRDLLLDKMPGDSLEKNFLKNISAADINSTFAEVVDSIPNDSFKIDYTLDASYDLKIVVSVKYLLVVNDFVDSYITTHQPKEIIDTCRDSMKDMSADEKREWLLDKLPSRAYSAAKKAFDKIPDRDFDQVFDDGVDMIPDESFTISHITGTNRYEIMIVWECDPIIFADAYYQNTYIKNRALNKLAEYGLTPTTEEWALYNRLLPSKFVNDMGSYHTLMTADQYYKDAHEILDLVEVAFRSRDYSVYGEKVNNAIEKGVPKALAKAREKGVTIVDDQGVAITDDQCVVALKALYQNPDITVNDLIDTFGSDYVKIAVSAKGRDTEIMISRVALS